jgi:galactose mutarotase-like enzyme
MVTLENNWLTVNIESFGAEMQSVVDRKTGYEFMWQADEDYWGRHAPVLFPIVGRLKNNQYKYEGKTYDMTQHGFARDSEFAIEEVTANSAVFSLEDSEDTLKIYPFKFKLYVKYLLHKNNVTVTYEVVNPSTADVMYYGIGGHPAFNVAQELESDAFAQVSFQLDPEKEYNRIPLTEDGLLKTDQIEKSGANIPKVTHDTFQEDALVYEIDPQTVMVLSDQTNQVEIRLQLSRMDYVGVWSPYPKRAGFICLEPWAGIADTMDTTGQYDEKLGINELNPNEKMTHDYTIEFTKKAQL